VDTEPGERMEAQNRQSGLPEDSEAGERIPEDRWDRETTAGDVTIHRRRR
jgi:hypothetical protein